MQTVQYHAVIRTENSGLGTAAYTVWGPANPDAFDQLCAAAEHVRQHEGSSVSVEVSLSGTGKSVVAAELIQRFRCHSSIHLIVR